MSNLRVHSFSISIDGYGAGPNQDLENPRGVGGLKLRTLTQPLPKGEETVVLTRAHVAADARQ